MQDNILSYMIKVMGADQAVTALEKVSKSGQKAVRETNNLSTASSKASKSQYQLADGADKAADATDKAGRSQAEYFKHIAKTTIQSALINKLFLEMVDVSGQAIQQVDLMQNFPATMESMGESTDRASEAMDTLRTYVGQVGGNLGDATSMVTRFVGATGNVKAATAIFVGLNNALIAGDSSFEEQRLAAIQFAQALERGRPDMREWRALTQNMSFQLAQVAEAMGYVSANALGEALTTGEESMAAFSTTLTELSTGMGPIAQQAIVRMQGMQFAFNVLKNTMVQGLAAIINAFGRSNIVSLFSFLTQVIQVLTGWVVNLVRALMWLVSIILGLFGLPAVQLQDDMEGVASAVGAGADSAGDLGDGLKGAGKEAKKLQKSLAGFDKMNVLPDKESGSGGGGGGGSALGGAGFDPGLVGDLSGQFGDIDSKLQAVSKWAKIFAGILAGIFARRLIKNIFDVDLLDVFSNAIKAVAGFLGRLPGRFINFAKSASSFIVGAFKSARETAGRAFTLIRNKATEAAALISLTWQTLGPRIAEQFRILKTNIATILQNLGVTDFFRDLQVKTLVILYSLRDSISNVFQNIKKRIIDPLIDIAQSIANVFSAGKSIVVSAVKSFVDDIVVQFIIIKTRIAEALTNIGQVIKNAFETVKNVVKPVILGVVAAIVAPFIYLGQKISNAITGLVEIGKTIANKIKSGIATYVTPILGPLAKIGKDLGQGIIETTRAALGPFGDVAVKAVKGFKRVFERMGNVINPVIKGVFNSIGKKMKQYGTSISNRLKSGMKFGLIGLGGILTAAFSLVLREGPEALVEKVNTFIQKLLTGPETILAIIESVKTMFATIAAQAETIVNAVVQMITIFVNAIIEYGPMMIQTFFNAVLELIGTLTQPESIDKILTGTITLITNIVKGIGKTLPKILTTMIDLVVDLIEMITKPDMINMIIETTIDLLLKILIAMIDALPKIINGMIKVLLAIIDVITRPDILDKIIDATIDLILTIVFALIDNIDKLIMAAVRLIVAIAKGLWDNRGKILDAIKQIGARIISRLGEVDWIQAGKDIVYGLWNGISSLTQWVINKVKDFGGNVLGGLKSFFGIESPSKVMREEVGKMLGLGLADGIEDSAKAAVSSAETAANQVTGVFKNMQTDVGEIGSDFSVSGSLTRSVDMVASGLERVEPDEYRPYDQTGEAIGKLITGSREDGQMLNLTVKIGEDQIANKVINLINEKTNMSGRNAIRV